MGRVDHVLVSVADLEEACLRWTGEGLSATIGGRHPGGTVNALVRGPEPAYFELISVGPGATTAAADRVNEHRGPLAWGLGVSDIVAARHAAEGLGYAPAHVLADSRTTPSGEQVNWLGCDVGPTALHSYLPFLIQWQTPMEGGPADGPALTSLTLEVPDPEDFARLLQVWGMRSVGQDSALLTDGTVEVHVREGAGEIVEAGISVLGARSRTIVIDGLRLVIHGRS